MELILSTAALHRVGRGQTLSTIAEAFGTTPRLLARANALCAEPCEGTLLVIPPAGALYTVRGGETKALLCGSPARYEERNATPWLYPGQRVVL